MKTKSITIIVLALCIPVCLHAQYYNDYYHRIGDTVQWKSPTGYYLWWDFQHHYEHNIKLPSLGGGTGYRPGKALNANYFFTTDTLKVIGLAAVYSSNVPAEQEYFYLFDAQADSMVMKYKIPKLPGVESNRRYVHVMGYCEDPGCATHNPLCSPNDIVNMVDSCCGDCQWTWFLPLYEHYFDSAVYVTDSFYVGFSCFSHPYAADAISGRYSEPGSFPVLPQYYHAGATIIDGTKPCQESPVYTHNGHSNCEFPFLPCAWVDLDTSVSSGFTPFRWYYRTVTKLFLIYPIIEVDTTIPPADLCPPVSNFRLSLLEDGCATFTWDDCVNYSGYEVRYRTTADGPYGWSYTTTGSNIFQLCDLDSSATYFVSVRALCDISKKSTDWTDPVYFRLTNPQNGIEAPESALGSHTFLSPNPARDRVVASSHFLVTRVDAYDARGTLVYSEPSRGLNADINISAWPKGSYVFIIHTHHGATAKVLVKE